MGSAIRLVAIVLMMGLAVALVSPLACAQVFEEPTLAITQSTDRIVEGGSASFEFTLDLWEEYFLSDWDHSSVTCIIDPSTTARIADFTITPAFSNPYIDEVQHAFIINTVENNRYERNNSTINISITLHVDVEYSIFGDYIPEHDHIYWANFTLVDNTSAVFFAPENYTVNETDDSVTLTLVRAGNRTGSLSVDYSTVDGTATDSDDFHNKSGKVTFGPGDSNNKTITINLKNKHVNSTSPVSFYVNLTNAIGGIIAGNNATIVINQNAPAGVFSLRTNNATVMEDCGSITFTIDRDVPAGKASDGASVTFSTTPVTAHAGQDYETVVTTLVFSHSETSKTVSVPIHDTAGYDGMRYFTAQLKEPGGGASIDLEKYSYDVKILDGDLPPSVSFQVYDESMDEGAQVTISIVISGRTNVSGKVLLSVDSSSTAPPGRFTCNPPPGILEFDPGETSTSFLVNVPFDPGDQEVQYVTFLLSGAEDLRIGANYRNVLTINNVPPIGPTVPAVMFATQSAIIDRGTAGYSLAIWRTSTNVDSDVTFEVMAGNAAAGTDYGISPAPGSTIHFGTGDSEGMKSIQISVPSTLAGDKTLSLRLVPLWNATLADPSTITLTLRDLGSLATPTPTPAPPIDSFPLLLQVSVAPDTITPGAEAIVNVTVTDGTSPVAGASVSAVTSRGTLTPLTSLNANGKYFWKLKSDSPGSCTLSITATAGGYQPGSASATVQVVSAPVGSLGLSMAITPDPVPAGSDAMVAITVTADGRPLQGAMVNILSTGGILDPPIGSTGQDGVFRATFRADTIDTYVLTVTATATGHPATSGSYGINVVEAAGRRLYCTLYTRPQSIGPGGSADVIVMVTDGSGPVEGADVDISVTGGSIGPSGGKTGPDGTFTARLVASDTGTYTLTAQATAPDSVPASASALVDVRSGLINAQIILLGLAALLTGGILLGGLFLLVGKLREISLKATPKSPYVQADGSSRLPVRVEAYNGFGKPKRMRRNTHVDLETTAGKIEDIIIPAGKSFADAVLTSSRDFGMVTVTARLGDRAVASTPVEFRLENGSLAVSVSPSSLIADSKSSATITVRVRNGKGQYVSPLEERAVELKTTLGDIIGSITTMPARAQSANARILSPGSIGMATITATMGNLKGTSRVEFKGLPTRPCSQCGQPVANSATICPWCGQDPRPAAAAKMSEATVR